MTCRTLASSFIFCLLGFTVPATEVHRVTTVSAFPRGLEMVDGELYVLSRGRVRDSGGVSAEINDGAGVIYRVDPMVAQSAREPLVLPAVRENGEVFALPTAPPFHLWDRSANPPWKDRETDRPYCGLRWHEPTRSFYICAFSGVDKARGQHGRNFSKNLTDAVLRYDTRTGRWSEVERHDIEAGGLYPHHDPATSSLPHGWLNGPDNLLPVGDWLYVVAKDNSVLIRYDLSVYIDDPDAGAAPSEWILGDSVPTSNAGTLEFRGHSALAYQAPWLYIASRTSSHIIRLKLDEDAKPEDPRQIELVATFDPWTPSQSRPADITDMAFDSIGRLYVVNAQPSRVHRFTPNPDSIYDAREGARSPWKHFAEITGNRAMKSENLFITDEDVLFITSGDGYDFQAGAGGTVYRMQIVD